MNKNFLSLLDKTYLQVYIFTIVCFFRYVEWICRAEDLVLAEERTTEDDRKLIMEAREKAAAKIKKLSHTQKQDSVETNSLEEGGINKDSYIFKMLPKLTKFFVKSIS